MAARWASGTENRAKRGDAVILPAASWTGIRSVEGMHLKDRPRIPRASPRGVRER
jgi:hypothetical protein